MAPDPNKKGLVAVGAYLRRLRTHRQMTPTVTAASVGTDPSMLNRIEKGNIDTRGSLLLALTQAVGGNVSDVQRLMHDHYATAITGEQRANAWIALVEMPPTPDEVQQLTQALTTLAQPATAPTLSDEEQRQRLALLRATLRDLTPRSDDPPVHS
ncbi:MAG: helix-turn-helix transcriptional regulator [Chloroflexaceae bacterium]